jgi:hypothetical protein
MATEALAHQSGSLVYNPTAQAGEHVPLCDRDYFELKATCKQVQEDCSDFFSVS